MERVADWQLAHKDDEALYGTRYRSLAPREWIKADTASKTAKTAAGPSLGASRHFWSTGTSNTMANGIMSVKNLGPYE